MKSILIYLTLWPQRQEQGCFFSYVKLQIDLDFITFLFSNVRILDNLKCTQQDIFNSKYFLMKNFRSEMCCNMSVLFCGGKFIQIFCDFVKLIIYYIANNDSQIKQYSKLPNQGSQSSSFCQILCDTDSLTSHPFRGVYQN